MRRARCLLPKRALSLAAAATVTLPGCFDQPVFDEPAEADGVVFFDGFAEGVDFQAFAGTNQANPAADGLAIDTDEHHSGRASLRVVVPGIGDPAGAYAGGAFVAGAGRDLSGYNALRFFAKATRAVTFDVLGFGNGAARRRRHRRRLDRDHDPHPRSVAAHRRAGLVLLRRGRRR